MNALEQNNQCADDLAAEMLKEPPLTVQGIVDSSGQVVKEEILVRPECAQGPDLGKKFDRLQKEGRVPAIFPFFLEHELCFARDQIDGQAFQGKISINLMSGIFSDNACWKHIMRILKDFEYADHVVFEITEAAQMPEPEKFAKDFDILKAKGYQFSIDDLCGGCHDLIVPENREYIKNLLRIIAPHHGIESVKVDYLVAKNINEKGYGSENIKIQENLYLFRQIWIELSEELNLDYNPELVIEYFDKSSEWQSFAREKLPPPDFFSDVCYQTSADPTYKTLAKDIYRNLPEGIPKWFKDILRYYSGDKVLTEQELEEVAKNAKKDQVSMNEEEVNLHLCMREAKVLIKDIIHKANDTKKSMTQPVQSAVQKALGQYQNSMH